MKTLLSLLSVVMSAAAFAADSTSPIVVTVSGIAYASRPIDNAATGTASAPLVFGGIGDAPTEDWSGKIVLMDRGVLTFAAKVKAVQDAGGVGAVIANNVTGPANTATLGTDTTSTIPAVTVSKDDGATLKGKVALAAVARIGAALPPPVVSAIPDPVGHKGEFVVSDGEKYVLALPPAPEPATPFTTEATAGTRVSLAVSSLGTAPFTFQWLKDGSNIPGATSSALVLASTTPADAGQYVCQVSNGFGTTPSAICTLVVK